MRLDLVGKQKIIQTEKNISDKNEEKLGEKEEKWKTSKVTGMWWEERWKIENGNCKVEVESAKAVKAKQSILNK